MKKNISVTVIGKSGHAARLISIIEEMSGVDLAWVYYPKKAKINNFPLTNNFDKILESDAIIIASPTYTHADYLRRLKDFTGYVLVEKPAVSTSKETEELKKYPKAWKKRLKVNFNFQYSKTTEILKFLIEGSDLGEPISLEVHTSHGQAFKKGYMNSWRSNLEYSFGVLELVGVHYINLAINLFGRIKDCHASLQWKAKKGGSLPPDTASLTLMTERDVRVNLYHSYAGPYFNKIMLIGTNGYFDYDGKIAKLYSPRDLFDSKGRFKSPPIIKTYELSYGQVWKDSLVKSLSDFIKVARKKGEFSLTELDDALAAMEPIFFLRDKA